MSINYVLAAWSGMRRVNPPRYVEEREVFLKKHVESLSKLRHSLTQVTIVVAQNKEEPHSYRRFLESLPSKVGSARVVLLERPNVGYSFGAYSEVYGRYRGDFDYYLLMEDDYAFAQDDFDTILWAKLRQDEKNGMASFVCEAQKKDWLMHRARNEQPIGSDMADIVEKYVPDSFVFPRIMVGLVRQPALEAVYREYGRLPYADGTNHTKCKFEGQFALPISLQKLGWNVVDMLPRWRSLAFGPGGERLNYGPMDRELLVKALQFEI